jgi:hypothetical protein
MLIGFPSTSERSTCNVAFAPKPKCSCLSGILVRLYIRSFLAVTCSGLVRVVFCIATIWQTLYRTSRRRRFDTALQNSLAESPPPAAILARDFLRSLWPPGAREDQTLYIIIVNGRDQDCNGPAIPSDDNRAFRLGLFNVRAQSGFDVS